MVQEPGDCCPRCVDDNPCLNPHQETGGADMSAYVCHYKGETRHHGDTWYLDSDPCTKCECKVSNQRHEEITAHINIQVYT